MLLWSHAAFIMLFAASHNVSPNPNHSADHSSMSAVYERLTQHLLQQQAQQADKRQYWVAIAGGAGSGKTTLAHAIAQRLNQHAAVPTVVVPMDGFHYSKVRLQELYGPQGLLRRGAPWTFDAKAMVTALVAARGNQQADLPGYDRNLSDPVPAAIHILPHHRVVLVEGLYVLHDDDPRFAGLAALFDERWFVKAPTRDIQRQRLVQRSLKTWNEHKARQWGPGVEGATKRVNENDFQNMNLIEYCEELADQVIVTV